VSKAYSALTHFSPPPLVGCLGFWNQALHVLNVAGIDGAIAKTKKADVAEHPEVFGHVGLLFDEPPSVTGLLFNLSSDD
jgi:hypothetical protein